MGNERPKPGPYKCMLTLTSKTRFGVMRGCQEQNREGDLGGSPVFRWTGRPKADNILLVRWGVTHTHAHTHTHTYIYIYEILIHLLVHAFLIFLTSRHRQKYYFLYHPLSKSHSSLHTPTYL